MGKSSLRVMISKTVAKMLGAPYRLGGMSPEAGFDCMSYIYYFLRGVGAELPLRSTDGTVSIEDYPVFFERDPVAAKALLRREGRGVLQRVAEPGRIAPADVLIAYKRGEDPTTSIYVGAGNILSCDVRVGIIVCPRTMLACDRMEVLRPCLRQSL